MKHLSDAVRRLGRRAQWSVQGWRAAWVTQTSLRQWTGVTLVSAVRALLPRLSAGERALLLALGLLLLAAEMFNTAIKAAVDFVSTARDPRGAMAKECASAAVALTALAGFVAWCAILWGMNGFSLCRGTGRSMSDGTAPSCRARKGIRNVLQRSLQRQIGLGPLNHG
jgi:diacylglycerol kinase (ATP)